MRMSMLAKYHHLPGIAVPKDYCRESTDADAKIACFDCMCPQHRMFCESLWAHRYAINITTMLILIKRCW